MVKKIIKTLKKIIFNCAKYSVRALYYLGTYILSPKDNIILFESSNGRNYSGNPRYVYEEILNEGLQEEFRCVWVFMNPEEQEIPGNGIKVKKSYFKFLYYAIRSGTWIFDSRHLYYLKKNKKTKYIQTWHGTTLKKLGLDMDYMDMSGSQNIKRYHDEFKKNSSKWEYLISQNSYSSEIFKRAFAFNGKMLEIGYPRNDILINNNNKDYIDQIKSKFNIPKEKKVILYAPTWRDNEYYEGGKYKFATKMDFDKMKEALSDDFVLIVKYHYLVKDNIDWKKYDDFIIECDAKWDIQELYLASDIMITDYSSVMFDYAILRRPMLFFTYDLDFYKNSLRDFYFDMLEEVPGPLVENTGDLVEEIKNLNIEEYEAKYGEKYNNFQRKYNEFDKGTASKTVIEMIRDRN